MGSPRLRSGLGLPFGSGLPALGAGVQRTGRRRDAPEELGEVLAGLGPPSKPFQCSRIRPTSS